MTGVRVTVLLSSRVADALALVVPWARAGDAVTVVLVDAAVAVARSGHADAEAMRAAVADGVTVVAHDAAARRRSLDGETFGDGIETVELDEIADLVTTAEKAVWW